MARNLLVLAAVLVMTLNMFSVPVFASPSPCPAMDGKSMLELSMMDMSEMPCHDNLADCIGSNGCALMTTSPLFVLSHYVHPYRIPEKQEIESGDYNVTSQHIAPPKRPPRLIS